MDGSSWMSQTAVHSQRFVHSIIFILLKGAMRLNEKREEETHFEYIKRVCGKLKLLSPSVWEKKKNQAVILFIWTGSLQRQSSNHSYGFVWKPHSSLKCLHAASEFSFFKRKYFKLQKRNTEVKFVDDILGFCERSEMRVRRYKRPTFMFEVLST